MDMEPSRDTDMAAASSTVPLTRRGLLKRASWLVAAVACPGLSELAAQSPSPAPAGPAISPVMTSLSNYMSEARGRALPDEVVEKAKLHILDTLAAMISGSELPPGRA